MVLEMQCERTKRACAIAITAIRGHQAIIKISVYPGIWKTRKKLSGRKRYNNKKESRRKQLWIWVHQVVALTRPDQVTTSCRQQFQSSHSLPSVDNIVIFVKNRKSATPSKKTLSAVTLASVFPSKMLRRRSMERPLSTIFIVRNPKSEWASVKSMLSSFLRSGKLIISHRVTNRADSRVRLPDRQEKRMRCVHYCMEEEMRCRVLPGETWTANTHVG